jgi:glycosyltransferase involved in cell wall biosynthesis
MRQSMHAMTSKSGVEVIDKDTSDWPDGADTVVFLPAYNEAASLPDVIAELKAVLPDVDVVVIDDGSKDATHAVARAAGADVVSFSENQGLKTAIATGWSYAAEHGYRYCGRIDADGQHPPFELARLLTLVKSGACDVAVGSRFIAGDGYEAYRYQPSPSRRVGTAVLRRAVGARLGRPFHDATSGMYAARWPAFPLLSNPYYSGAPEVEGLIRLEEAHLDVAEVPVDMREREHGESHLQGKTAVKLVLTVAGTLLLSRRARRWLS